jgi:hypothetical protein
MRPITLDDEYSYPLHMTGQASALPPEQENEAVRQLHAAVKEVTGKDVEQPQKPRIGFLP